MAYYKLEYTVPLPGSYASFIEFSPNGRFLAVGDQHSPSLYLLDRRSGFHPTLSAITPEKPTALIWETSEAFYVGLADGRFTYYRIDLRGEKLAEGATTHSFRGVFPAFPVTAMALNADSQTLVASVGPEVFAFRRIYGTHNFRLISKISGRFNFATDPGRRVPPFPRAICFTPDNTLVVTFCRQNIASAALEFERDSHLGPSFRVTKIDYSGLPLLKAITSADGERNHQLARCWIHGGAPQPDGNRSPFLFINEGAATLSNSGFGSAVIRDAVTRRRIQLLDHIAVVGRKISFMSYHVSYEKYSIVTADCGEGALIKVWSAQRSPSHPQGQSHNGFPARMGWIAATLVALSVIVMQRLVGRVPNAGEISRFVLQISLLFMKPCIRIGYTILKAAEDLVLVVEDFLD